MFVYSKNIIRFIQQIRHQVKEVLSQEIRLKVSGNRFYDRKGSSYPISIVIYNHKNMLGYFDPSFYELGFHESLMHTTPTGLRNIIRHELAHYMTFLNYGDTVEPHGPEFKAFCKKMNWQDEVCLASTHLEQGSPFLQKPSPIFRKIQKLMALSTSTNSHEAELAMIKSQQLLLKHNIDSSYLLPEDEEKMGLKRILKQKKANAKMRAIGRILETFFVSTVYHRAKDYVYLEILGSIGNIEIAEYVADILQCQFDQLWKAAQKSASLKGAVAKNSFFSGIAKGYCNKIQSLKRDYTQDVTQALMVIEKQLSEAQAMAYPRLSTSRAGGSHCRHSSALGEQMGGQLNIHAGIHSSSKHSEALITHKH